MANNPEILIRPEAPSDADAIRSIHDQAFGQAAEANLVSSLRARNCVTLSLVAVKQGQVVGHVLFSPVTIESQTSMVSAVGLGPVAVLPELQRSGIGSMLIKSGLDQLKSSGESACVVLGHSEYYPRFGFVPASRLSIRCKYDVPDEVFMALEFRKGSLGAGGLALYQPEFDET